MQMTIPAAAAHLQLSTQTVRRRVHSGVIKGEKLATAQGFRWMLDIEGPINSVDDPSIGNVEIVALLQDQLIEKDRQIAELHQLLARTALPAAAAPPWWRFWQ